MSCQIQDLVLDAFRALSVESVDVGGEPLPWLGACVVGRIFEGFVEEAQARLSRCLPARTLLRDLVVVHEVLRKDGKLVAMDGVGGCGHFWSLQGMRGRRLKG